MGNGQRKAGKHGTRNHHTGTMPPAATCKCRDPFLWQFFVTFLDNQKSVVYNSAYRLPESMTDASGGLGSRSFTGVKTQSWSVDRVDSTVGKPNAGIGWPSVNSTESADELVSLKGDAAGQIDPALLSLIQPHHPPPRHQRRVGRLNLSTAQQGIHHTRPPRVWQHGWPPRSRRA